MALSSDFVGLRVVVRVRVPGETGLTGGPAMRDVLGVLRKWEQTHLVVEREDGTVETIRRADVVTGKPVPPRGSVRQRVPAAVLQRVCAEGWQAPRTRQLGDWLLRAAGGFTGRANSALVAGDPAMPLADALRDVVAFYAECELPALAQVVVGSAEDDQLTARGWVRARPEQPDAIVQVASVAIAVRHRRHAASDDPVTLDDSPSSDWIQLYGRSQEADPHVVRQVLTSGRHTSFAQIGDPAVAIGRGVVTGDWIGLSAVEVAPSRRREGLGSTVVAELLEWGASLGARSAYLQTLPDNPAALALYQPFGFVTHHAYRYLRPG
jgi:GNAT superfamily N-acetyltransferase